MLGMDLPSVVSVRPASRAFPCSPCKNDIIQNPRQGHAWHGPALRGLRAPGKPGVSVLSVFKNLRALRVKQLVGQ